MPKSTNTSSAYTYHLHGKIGYWWEYSYNESSVWKGQSLDEIFSAPSDEDAMTTSRKMVEEFLQKHPQYHPVQIKEKGEEPVFLFVLEKVLLEIQWNSGQPEIPAVLARKIPAQPAIPAVEPHVAEKVLI